MLQYGRARIVITSGGRVRPDQNRRRRPGSSFLLDLDAVPVVDGLRNFPVKLDAAGEKVSVFIPAGDDVQAIANF